MFNWVDKDFEKHPIALNNSAIIKVKHTYSPKGKNIKLIEIIVGDGNAFDMMTS